MGFIIILHSQVVLLLVENRLGLLHFSVHKHCAAHLKSLESI